jgi:hypothetical protein
MAVNPFSITKAEGFNHSYEQLALLMQLKSGVADVLLGNTNVLIEGSRGSGKSMYLRLLSLPVKTRYEALAATATIEPLPSHLPYVGAYLKLAPTIFGPHEYETRPRFGELFQQLFNVYCAEHLVATLAEASAAGTVTLASHHTRMLVREIGRLILPPSTPAPSTLLDLFGELRSERKRIRQALNEPPYNPDSRAQSETLWEIAEAVTRLPAFANMRVHLLIDEYDSLSEYQQRVLNLLLRKRDFPLTFKIACKKHRLVQVDIEDRPLNPSGDFDPVELDDDDFGRGSTFQSYLEGIANKRLRNAGLAIDIRTLLGSANRQSKPKTERQYAGFETVTTLSSGIVRTFLELCRDMYSLGNVGTNSPSRTIPLADQDRVIKMHAAARWNSLARDQSARPELQHLIAQTAKLFAFKSTQGVEKQVIRLEIIDFERTSRFVRSLLNQSLEYEALVQPNRERLQKNRRSPSRGYLLNRLLCVHFRLEPQSRWDVEISAEQLERLILEQEGSVESIARHPTRREGHQRSSAPRLLESMRCPILDQECPRVQRIPGVGFLSCRLPDAGPIRDAARLIKEEFVQASTRDLTYRITTAEDYPPEGDIACKVCRAITEAQFVLVEFSGLSPSVAMEFGLSVSRRLPTYLLFNSEDQRDIPEPFSSLEYIRYDITPAGVRRLVRERLLSFLSAPPGPREVRIGPHDPPPVGTETGIFIALPGTKYHQETVLPELRHRLEAAGLGPVRTEQEGRALQDLHRAASAIAQSKYCLIDTTQGAPTRALYLGMAQGYRKPFANLVDIAKDPAGSVFTNARSKAEMAYRDSNELLSKVSEFFGRFGESV